MEERRVLVTNVTNSVVSLSFPNYHFSRELRGEGAHTYIPFEILFEGMSDEGVRTMIEEGIIQVGEHQDRVDLGIEQEDEKVEGNIKSSAEILQVLTKGDPVAVNEMLEKLALSQKEKVATVAIDNNITNYGICQIILKHTGIDVIKNIMNNKEDN